jgi:Sulfotransferase family
MKPNIFRQFCTTILTKSVCVPGSCSLIIKTSIFYIFRSMCDVRPLRVAKVVRASMLSMKPLLDWLPDLRIIHLVRDPRPVALSRRDFHGSARGQFAESTVNLTERTIREAFMYCRQVVADVRLRQRLEQEYPGRLYSLTYEQLVDDPIGRAGDIYRFIGETPGRVVMDRFSKLATGKAVNESAKYLGVRWLNNRISRLEFDTINEQCSELFHLYPEYLHFRPETFRTQDVVIATRAPPRRGYSINQHFPIYHKRPSVSHSRGSRTHR